MSTQMIPFLRLGHIALRVTNMADACAFYQNVFMMKVVWQPDADNVYLSCGKDNIALHKIPKGQRVYNSPPGGEVATGVTPLDHFGFMVDRKEDVDTMAERIIQMGVPIKHPVRLHRDGSYSFYIEDPDHNLIQILYEPNISQNGPITA